MLCGFSPVCVGVHLSIRKDVIPSGPGFTAQLEHPRIGWYIYAIEPHQQSHVLSRADKLSPI